MGQATPLHQRHVDLGAKIVDFGGWDMPVVYTSINEEHLATRQHAGVFDISHMGRLVIEGPDATEFLERMLTNQVATLKPGQVRYSLVLNDDGRILDDILVYRLAGEDRYLLVVNASNRMALIPWFISHVHGLTVHVSDQTHRSAMIAIQGPLALAIMQELLKTPIADMAYYSSSEALWDQTNVLLSRTGYTGEDGFEIAGPPEAIGALWDRVLNDHQSVGVRPAGLGARDTLRLEAGMPLYGHELSTELDPIQAGLGWAVKAQAKDFIGRDALSRRDPDRAVRIGLVLEGRRIARQGFEIKYDGKRAGAVTSGTFSPTLQQSIAMGYVEPRHCQTGTELTVDVRGTEVPATVAALPFYRRPKTSP